MTAAFQSPKPEGLFVRRIPAPAPDPTRVLLGRNPDDRPTVLRSGPGDQDLCEWSYSALHPTDTVYTVESARRILDEWAAPATQEELPPFTTGAVGYLSYDIGWALQAKPRLPRPDPFDMPPVCFHLYDALYAKNERTQEGYLIAQDTLEARQRLARIQEALATPHITPTGGLSHPLAPGVCPAAHKARIREILDLIRAGEVYQVNLTYPLVSHYTGAPEAAFVRLARCPPPFAAYIEVAPEQAIVSASPECFFDLNVATHTLSAYPIKGTRARSPDPEQDHEQARLLIQDPKERAEHIMIVDLLRNDLGRIVPPGGVSVNGLAYVESFPTVHHLTSRIVARFEECPSVQSWLSALVPGGSITGAPKLRAMEIIDRLEDAPRGIYTGAIAYMTPQGDVRASIAIRTAQIAHGEVRFGVGGGIVADSDPEREWTETEIKAQALSRALGA